jgi:hypothetical protein
MNTERTLKIITVCRVALTITAAISIMVAAVIVIAKITN